MARCARTALPGTNGCVPCDSEYEFGCELDLSWRVGADDLAEACAADIAVHRGGSEELRMIEDIEGFQSELQHFGFRDRHFFLKSDVEVVQSRPIKEASPRIPELP